MKRILIISYSPLHRDPRVLRQIQALKNSYKICTIGDTPIPDNTITHYSDRNQNNNDSGKKRKLLKALHLIKNLYRFRFAFLEVRLNLLYIFSLPIPAPDLIIANDWDGLYLASELKKRNSWKEVKIYFDAHECAHKQYAASLRWRLFDQPSIIWALRRCRADITVMSTVCNGIAKEYERFFNFPDGFVKVVTNAAEYSPMLKPNKTEGVIKLIHHGGAIKRRKLELMIEMMKYLDPGKYELTFMLVKSEPAYYDDLVKKSRHYRNIKFLDSVSYSEIVNALNYYDIGIYILKPYNFNQKHALPNKFFEFIQARLAIAIGASPEMANIVDRYSLGDHSNDFNPKSLAMVISRMTPDKIMEYKANADKYAMELSAEKEKKQIKTFIKKLIEE